MNRRLIIVLLFFFVLLTPLVFNSPSTIYEVFAGGPIAPTPFGPGPVVPPGGNVGGGTGTTIPVQTPEAGKAFNGWNGTSFDTVVMPTPAPTSSPIPASTPVAGQAVTGWASGTSSISRGSFQAPLPTATPTADYVVRGWNGTSFDTSQLDYSELANAPTLGTAAAADTTDFIAATDPAIAKLNQSQTLTNKILDDSTTSIANTGDPTKEVQLLADNIPTGTKREYYLPEYSPFPTTPPTILTNKDVGITVAPLANPTFTGVLTIPTIAGVDPACAAAHFYWDSADTCSGATNGALHYCDNTPTDFAVCPYAGGSGTAVSGNTINLDINGLTAKTTPEFSADYVPCYDSDGSANKKCLINLLAYGMQRSIEIDAGEMSVGGAATQQEELLYASSLKTWDITLTASTSDTFAFKLPMPLNWDGGPIVINYGVFNATNDSTKTLTLEFYGTCVNSGEAVPTWSTTGNQTATVTFGNATNLEMQASTNPLTLNAVSTCAGGSMVMIQGQYNTGTPPTMTTVRLLWVKVLYRLKQGSEE